MGGLAWAMRDISTGTAYAVWVGIGAALTVIWAMVTGDSDVSWMKLALIAGLVGWVVGLKLVEGRQWPLARTEGLPRPRAGASARSSHRV
jgi:quaternary ammonium compound-resistance protein SugE